MLCVFTDCVGLYLRQNTQSGLKAGICLRTRRAVNELREVRRLSYFALSNTVDPPDTSSGTGGLTECSGLNWFEEGLLRTVFKLNTH